MISLDNFANQCKTNNKEFDHTKFAELLIRECLGICKDKLINDEYVMGRLSYRHQIKEHFGIE